MRTIVTSLLLFVAVPLIALAQTAQAPPSAANVVRLHPGPWRMPAAVSMGVPNTNAVMLARSQAEARVLAAQNITRHADGSRHAVVGAAFRSYEVVTIDADGNLTQDCVPTEAEARARVEAGAPKQVRK